MQWLLSVSRNRCSFAVEKEDPCSDCSLFSTFGDGFKRKVLAVDGDTVVSENDIVSRVVAVNTFRDAAV